MTPDPHLFAGLKVVDCATWVAGPAAATILGDFGAEVIKVEPPAGDDYRLLSTRPGLPEGPELYGWLLGNRNKRSIALDLKQPEARDVLERLVAGADIFVTNHPLPVRERLRIRHADFAATYPRLIYASLTAYGEEGEEAAKTGFDGTAYWARSGLMDQVRPDSTATPAASVTGMGDHPTAVALYAAIATALYRRERTGVGGEVRASLLQAGMWANAWLIQAALCGYAIPPRRPREQAGNALATIYRTQDGRWLSLLLSSQDRQWPALAAAIGQPHLAADPRFIDTSARAAHVDALRILLEEAFATRPLAEWRAALDAAGLTFGIVATVAEAAADPQARAIGALRPLQGESLAVVDSPFAVQGSPKVTPRRAPEHGAHSSAILREAGYTEAEIATLKASQAVLGT